MNKRAFYIPTLLIFAGLLFSTYLQAQVKKLYIANDDHTDYMWTGNEAQYDSAFVHMLDYYLNQIDSTKNNAPDFQARFNCDGNYWLTVYQKYRTPAQLNRLINAIRSGNISVPLNSLVSTYGAQPTEAVIRGMFAAGEMERKYKLQFNLAVCMENQTLPLGLSSLWAGSGAKYSWRGVCGCASRISNASLANRNPQLYRYTGLDGTGVIMKWYNRVFYNGRTLGGYAEARREKQPTDMEGDIEKIIADLDTMCDTVSADSKYKFNVAGAFGFGWDDLETYVSPMFITAAKNSTTTRRNVRVSNEEDFFKEVEKRYPNLPSESHSFGNEWDTYCASMNEITARVRRSTERLRTAEALASVASMQNKSFTKPLIPARDKAWEAFGLYWEHDWTADAPTVSQKDRAEWQIKLQKQITGYTDSLFNLSKATLGAQIKKSNNTRFYVFNPLSWQRNDVADLEYEGSYPVRIFDVIANKQTVSQLINKGGKKFLRVYAEGIPSVGYKVFEIRQGEPAKFNQSLKADGEYVENKFYRLRLSPSGAITEIVDKLAGNKQLVKRVEGKYINDIGVTDVTKGDEVMVENAGPVSVTLKASSNFPIRHTVRVTLYNNTPRIEIEDSIKENYRDLKTWAFSFNLDNQTTRHEELGAVLTVKKETNGGHYAATANARYDWQTFNHFADMSNNAYGITLSNVDCSFFKLGNSTADSLWEGSTQLNALAGGQTDPYSVVPKNWKDTVMMGIYNQFGQTDFLYQFALTTHSNSFDATKAMKFSLEHQNPLVAAIITGNATAKRGNSLSLLNISNPNIVLWSVKPSEDGIGNGLITRFWNMGNVAARPSLKLATRILKAWKTTHIERDETTLKPVDGKLSLDMNACQINTYRVVF